ESTARAIEEVYRAQLDEHYGELAYHYGRSGNTQEAVHYLQLAGQQAVERSANAGAVSHFTSALELLTTLPDTPTQRQQELRLQICLGAPLMATKGYAAEEVVQAYNRARELCEQMGESPHLFPVLRGLWVFYLVRTVYQPALELAERLLSIAESVGE